MRGLLIVAFVFGLFVTVSMAAPTEAAETGGCEEPSDPDCGPICRDENGRLYMCSTPPPGP